jgi:hypothetical protein
VRLIAAAPEPITLPGESQTSLLERTVIAIDNVGGSELEEQDGELKFTTTSAMNSYRHGDLAYNNEKGPSNYRRRMRAERPALLGKSNPLSTTSLRTRI